MPVPTVLITGMSGLIGSAVRKRLEGKYALRALNRGPVAGVDCVRADITDLSAIEPAFAGVDVVVHLAAKVHRDAPWDGVLAHNIIGTYNVFEAARRAGVKRLIYASSGAAIGNYEREAPYSAVAAGRYEGRAPGHASPTRARRGLRACTAAARSGARPWGATTPTTTACP